MISLSGVAMFFLVLGVAIVVGGVAAFFFSAKIEGIVQDSLTASIPFQQMHPLWLHLVKIIGLVSGVIFSLLGLWLVFGELGASRRTRVKNVLKKMIMIAVGVSASYYGYYLLISLSGALTQSVLLFVKPENLFFQTGTEITMAEWVKNISLSNLGFIQQYAWQGLLSGLYFIGLILLTFTLMFRTLIITAGVALFPVAITLYLLPVANKYGDMMINILLLMIFLPVLDVLILAGGNALATAGFSFSGFLKVSTAYLVSFINIGALSAAFKPAIGGMQKVVVAPISKPVQKVKKWGESR